MKYSFRRGALTGDERIELTDTSVKLFKGKGKARREIAFADMKKIYGFSNMSVLDEAGGTFETQITQFTPKKGFGIRICSFSYIRMGTRQRQVATNNAEKYIEVVDEIKRRVAAANPDAMLVSGNIVASVLGYFLSFGGLGMIGLFIYATLFATKPIIGILPVLLIGVLIGLLFTWRGVAMGKSYWPVRKPLAETINNGSRTQDEVS